MLCPCAKAGLADANVKASKAGVVILVTIALTDASDLAMAHSLFSEHVIDKDATSINVVVSEKMTGKKG